MFNLFRSKGKAVNWMLTGLLVLLGLSMLLYLVPNYTTDTITAGGVLLEVGDRKLTTAEAEVLFRQSQSGELPPELAASFFPQWLDQQKKMMAIMAQADELGIVTSNDEIAEAMSQLPAFAGFFQNGKLTDRAGFETAVTQQGFSVDRIFELMHERLQTIKLQDALSQNSVVTPKELENAYKRKYERASVDYVSFSEDVMRTRVNVSDAEVRAQWEKTKAAYRQPEKYGFRVAVLSQTAVESRLNVTEQELRSAYAAARENFTTPEEVHARHILIKSDSTMSDSDKQAAKKKAEEVLKEVKAGGDFGELAKKYSEDTNAAQGGDLGTLSRNSGLPKPFEDAAFGLQSGQTSGIITTDIGLHIVQTVERIPSKVTPFDDVRADLEQALRQEKMAEAMGSTTSQMRAELAKTPADAASIVRKFGGELVTVPETERGSPIPTLGVSPEIEATYNVLGEGDVSEVIPMPGDRAVVVLMDKKVAGRESTFEEARNAVRSTMVNDQARQMVTDQSTKAAERLRAGEDIRDVAKSLNAEVQGASSFAMTDTLPDLGPAIYFEDAFTKGVGAVIGPTMMQGSMVVAKVVGKTEADLAGLASEKSELLLTLRQDRAQRDAEMILDSVVTAMTADGSLKVNEDEYQRLINALR